MVADPREGDRVSFNLKSKPTDGKVVKRLGMRLRVEHEGGICWIELREITSLLGNPAPESEPETKRSSDKKTSFPSPAPYARAPEISAVSELSDDCSADAKKEMAVHKNWNPHAPIGHGVPQEDQAPMRTKAISSTKKQTAEANVVYIQFPNGCATGAATSPHHFPRCLCHCARSSHDLPPVGEPS